MYIAISLGMIVGMVVGSVNYFARSKTVNLLDQRLELAIENDMVFQTAQNVSWMEQQTTFERRKEPKTVAETEIINKARRKLAMLEKRRELKQNAYDEAYRQQKN